MKRFIYYVALTFIGSAVILFLHYFHSAQYNIHLFDLNGYVFVLAVMLAIIIVAIAFSMLLDFFHEKDMQKADKRKKTNTAHAFRANRTKNIVPISLAAYPAYYFYPTYICAFCIFTATRPYSNADKQPTHTICG